MQVDLLGTSFSIQTDEEPEYVQKLLRFLEEKITETSQSVQTSDPLKIAIISAMMIADELFQSRNEQFDQGASRFSDIAQELIKQIDSRLIPEDTV